MTDRLHDHLTPGLRRGCVACAQVEADHALGVRALDAADDRPRSSTPSHAPGPVPTG